MKAFKWMPLQFRADGAGLKLLVWESHTGFFRWSVMRATPTTHKDYDAGTCRTVLAAKRAAERAARKMLKGGAMNEQLESMLDATKG